MTGFSEEIQPREGIPGTDRPVRQKIEGSLWWSKGQKQPESNELLLWQILLFGKGPLSV